VPGHGAARLASLTGDCAITSIPRFYKTRQPAGLATRFSTTMITSYNGQSGCMCEPPTESLRGGSDLARARKWLCVRIVQAMVEVVCEVSFASASIAAVCSRAKVSGRAFYEAFDSREECFLAALDEGHRRARVAVERASANSESWLDAVRNALVELLALFDREPQLARVCIVESLAAGRWALERREQHVASLFASMLVQWGPLTPPRAYPLANEAVIASVLGVVQHHLLAAQSESLTGLLGPLMGLAASPYLDTQAIAQEVQRCGALARRLLAERDAEAPPQARPGFEMPALLRHPKSHRARDCMRYVAGHPGVSNRQIARAVGIRSDTQISTMLARLARAGLVHKQVVAPGRPNSWSFTPYGVAAARALEADWG
jgi:AcrR family transcriptional regulator